MTRYLLSLPALALLGAAPPVTQSGPPTSFKPVPKTCDTVGTYARGDQKGPLFKRLGDLPPAEAYMAVYRTDAEGCLDPLLARDRQGVRRP